MPTVINTNLASLFAQNSLSNAQNNLAQSVQRLSSGLRINSAKDDAAGLSISQNMQSQINGTNQSIRNLSDATNLLQVADSSMATVQDMILRLKQLATQGYDGSLSTSQKLNIVQEMKDLNAEINATASRTAFNGIKLLSSGSSVDLNNSDIKAGTRLQNTAVSVVTTDNTKGLGFYSGDTNATGLGDAALGALGGVANTGTAKTTYTIDLNSEKLKQIPGSYVLTSNGANLTLTGTFNGLAQSQTVTIKDAIASNVSGQATTTDQILDFSNFGISINMRSVRGTGDQITGTTLASQLASSTYKNLQVAGVGGEVTNMNLSGVAPGTYTMTYNRTGAAVSLTAGLGQSIFAQPATGAVGAALAGVTFTGGSGSAGLTGTINYDASGNITTITTLGGTNAGFKAGDLLSASYTTSLTAPTYSSRAGGGGTIMASGSTATIVARDVKAGDVVRIEGKTLIATQNATADQVASVFRAATNAAGTALGFGTLSGAYTGSLAAAAPTGANANIILTATGADVTNATTFDVTKTVSNIIVGQDVNFSGGSSTVTMSGTVNGIATTQSVAITANAALATQNLNFDSFGVAFDVKSYQAQTADQIGATIATLNMGVGQSVAGGPGQVVVASGNNSALKFQSGPNSDAFIQIDTLNIQTGTTGQYAGSQSEMTTLGRVISQGGAGNLGTLGLGDTIDTWQTAFKNAAAAVDNALEYISTERAVYGSQMNRLSYVSTNLQAQSTNLQNSRSAIIDTDFAAETAKLTKGQIMQQAATAMLAQANQMPNVILSLLK